MSNEYVRVRQNDDHRRNECLMSLRLDYSPTRKQGERSE